MKKVLIIANLYYSSPRIPGIVNYLTDFGWEPTMITAPIKEDPKNSLIFPRRFKEKVRIIETPYLGDVFSFWRRIFIFFGFRKEKSILNQFKQKTRAKSQKSFVDYIFRLYLAVFAYPDTEKQWGKPAFKTAEKLWENEKFDAIISSSSPVTAHIIATKIKEKYRVPWIADLRYLWTQNHNYFYPWWRKIFDQKLELKTMSSADCLITVSYSLAEKLMQMHKGKKVLTVTNGFDPEKINEPAVNLTNKFTITYAGNFYIGKQDPTKILAVLSDLISKKEINEDDVELRFLGLENYWLQKEIEKYKISSFVKQLGKFSNKISLEKQKESQLLLFLNWEDKNQKGIYTTKFFEYLAAKRPIIATGGFGGDVIEETLKETNAGVYAPSIEDIKKYLRFFYSEYKKKGKVDYKGISDKISKYNYKEMAKKFANILNELV